MVGKKRWFAGVRLVGFLLVGKKRCFAVVPLLWFLLGVMLGKVGRIVVGWALAIGNCCEFGSGDGRRQSDH